MGEAAWPLRGWEKGADAAGGNGGQRGVDGVLITAASPSNDPVQLAGEICRDRGRVVAVGAVGMEIPRRPYYDKELSFFLSRSYGPGRYDPLYEEAGVDYPIGYVRWTEQRDMEAFLGQCAAGRPLSTWRRWPWSAERRLRHWSRCGTGWGEGLRPSHPDPLRLRPVRATEATLA